MQSGVLGQLQRRSKSGEIIFARLPLYETPVGGTEYLENRVQAVLAIQHHVRGRELVPRNHHEPWQGRWIFRGHRAAGSNGQENKER